MKFSLAVICGVFLASALMVVAAGRNETPAGSDDKAPLVESGYISKIDLKKKMLTVHGYVIALPDDVPAQKSGSPDGSRSGNTSNTKGYNFQAPGGGGRGGGGRGGSPAGRGGGRGAPNPDEALRDFSVYVHPDTSIQDEKNTIMLSDLKVEDYVVVLGTPKGKSINVDASSISVSNR
jgi:hypothetical protein